MMVEPMKTLELHYPMIQFLIIINMFMNPLIGKKTTLIRCHNSYCDILSQPKKTIAYRKNQKMIFISFYVKAV